MGYNLRRIDRFWFYLKFLQITQKIIILLSLLLKIQFCFDWFTIRSQGWLQLFDVVEEMTTIRILWTLCHFLDSMASSSSSKKIHFDTTDDELTEHEEEEPEVSVSFHRKKLPNLNYFWSSIWIGFRRADWFRCW